MKYYYASYIKLALFLLGKINTFHSSSDGGTTVNKEKMPNATIDCKNEIDMVKQESKMSIDGVHENLPKLLKTKENKVLEEVCL